MSGRPEFQITPHYEMYLPVDGTLVDVIATVVASRPTGPTPAVAAPPATPRLAEVILLDCSGSMGAPARKLFQARRAAIAALDALADGVPFAIVAGRHDATMIYPERPGLIPATAHHRAAARRQLHRVSAGGGTAMSSWLRLAGELFADRSDAIRHAILLTDGRNETETLADLEAVLASYAGRYTVDCRAIPDRAGVDEWRSTELLRIADALGANPVIPVAEPERLTDEFTALINAAMTRGVGDVRLRVRTSALAQVRFVKQVHPAIADLTSLGQAVDEQCHDYPIGAWGADQRDYHIGLEVQPLESGQSRRVAWLSLLVPAPGDTTSGGAPPVGPAAEESSRTSVDVEWTEDMARYTGINPTVAHFTRQEELAEAIRLAWEAFDEGRGADAEALMGRAVALAHRAGAKDKLAVFARVVEIDDAGAGLVRLRPDIDPGHWQVPTVTGHHTDAWSPPVIPRPAGSAEAAGTPGSVGTPAGSARSAGTPVGSAGTPAVPSADRPDEPCPRCATRRRARFCEQCGHDFVTGTASSGAGS